MGILAVSIVNPTHSRTSYNWSFKHLGSVRDDWQSYIWYLMDLYAVLLGRTFFFDTNVLSLKRNRDPHVTSMNWNGYVWHKASYWIGHHLIYVIRNFHITFMARDYQAVSQRELTAPSCSLPPYLAFFGKQPWSKNAYWLEVTERAQAF